MAEEDKDQAGDDLSAVEIPDLKKKQEKERKKAGAAWSSGKPAGSWQGAVGGNGAAGARGAMGAAGNLGGAAGGVGGNIGGLGGNLLSRGFFGALRAVFQGGGGIGGIMTRAAQLASEILSVMTATTAGKMAVAAAVAVAVGLAAILAARLLGGGDGKGGPNLAGLSSSIQIDRGGKSGLDYTKSGDTRLAQPAAPKPAEAVKTETAEKPQEAPPAEGDGMGVQEGVAGTQGAGTTDRMAHDLSGSKLSSGLGGNFQNTPFANVSAPKFPGLTKNKPLGFGKGDGRKGVGGRLMSRNVNANRNMNLRGLRSSRALGQVRGMGSQVGSIMQKAGESASADATTQFEGTTNSGGTAPTGPGTGPTGVEGTGGTGTTGGPGIDEPTVTPNACTDAGGTWDATAAACVFPTPPSVNLTPWQGKVAEAKAKLEDIKGLLDDIMYLWIAALALFALAAALWCSGGPAFLAAGLALVAIIIVKANKIYNLGKDIEQIGNDINAMDGGKPQGDIFIDFGQEAQTAAWVAATVPIVGAAIYGEIVSSALDKINEVEAQLQTVQ